LGRDTENEGSQNDFQQKTSGCQVSEVGQKNKRGQKEFFGGASPGMRPGNCAGKVFHAKKWGGQDKQKVVAPQKGGLLKGADSQGDSHHRKKRGFTTKTRKRWGKVSRKPHRLR